MLVSGRFKVVDWSDAYGFLLQIVDLNDHQGLSGLVVFYENTPLVIVINTPQFVTFMGICDIKMLISTLICLVNWRYLCNP